MKIVMLFVVALRQKNLGIFAFDRDRNTNHEIRLIGVGKKKQQITTDSLRRETEERNANAIGANEK